MDVAMPTTDGKVVTLIDAMAGIIKFNGKSYTDTVQNLLK